MDLNLSGRHALVCGASEGIGRAAAWALAEQGANVTALARREPVLNELVAALLRTHPEQSHAFLVADVSDRVRAACVHPLIAEDRVIGAMVFTFTNEHLLKAEERELVFQLAMEISDHAARAALRERPPQASRANQAPRQCGYLLPI